MNWNWERWHPCRRVVVVEKLAGKDAGAPSTATGCRSRCVILESSHLFMDTKPEAFELLIPIDAADIDALGHVNNVTYLRWVQEVAVAHWQAAAPAADQAALAWVVVRHEIDYKRPAFLHDQIVARTWVGTAKRHRFERLTELLRAADRKLLARARTIWCPIDRRTGKMTDVSPEVRARFSTPDSFEPA
jgi:acyl-CoA thioester hydrolase